MHQEPLEKRVLGDLQVFPAFLDPQDLRDPKDLRVCLVPRVSEERGEKRENLV